MQPQRTALKRLHVYWSGQVHGVGFRYTAESVALDLGLTGWVRNTPEGRVEAICEGAEAPLKSFLQQIKAGPMRKYIDAVSTDWEKATGEYDDFQIRFF